MIPVLTRSVKQLVGAHDAITNTEGLSGAISPDLRGDARFCTGVVTADIVGDITGIKGDITGFRGDFTGLSGDLSLAGIKDADRIAGIHVSDLTIKL
jgi:hypothetical protein